MSNVIIICLLVTNIVGFGVVIYLLYKLNDAYRALSNSRSKFWQPLFKKIGNISNDEDAIYAHTRDMTELLYDIRDILEANDNSEKEEHDEG